MTRKQAVLSIISYLDSIQNLPDDIAQAKILLQEMHCNMAWKIWNDTTIRAAIEKFIKENGRPPNTKDLAKCPYLPTVPSVYQVYKIPVAEWLRNNYPNDGISNWQYRYREVSSEELLNWFKKEYVRIKPRTEIEFRKQRGVGTPSWRYVANKIGIRGWKELIQYAGLAFYSTIREPPQFNVHSKFIYRDNNSEKIIQLKKS